MNPIAHAAQNTDGSWREPHDLAQHLAAVAALAACFARDYGEDWARLAGQWHDLGKYRPRFQRYIRLASGFEADAHIRGEGDGVKPGKAPHSTAGALLACDRFGVAGRLLAYLIAGHHAGLDDWHGGLAARLALQASREELNEALAESPPAALLETGVFTPNLRAIPGGKAGFALWVRLLFSALVDADFLDTEAYMDPDKAATRADWPSLDSLLGRYDSHMKQLVAEAPDTPVNRLRADILQQCLAAALKSPGVFSLTVPTGGGKTLSSLGFALGHASLHRKRRVIYVIPYTSIIEQTADILGRIFGPENVVEHHSNAESEPGQENHQSRLACENWDAPLIVTTNVQFFESLFAARTSRCRKLHNIVDSVVILDEAQLLPPEFLQPILDALRLLTEHYGVTVVLSTATQPALSTRTYFDANRNIRGIEAKEIIAAPDALYRALERVKVRLPADWHDPTDWDALATQVQSHDSVLAIVNRRQDARELWQRLPEGTLHLSALMCGAHRSHVIADIKTRLKAGIPTRVVSTQLVEAGVDVDFPVVYRALAGLDSIAQAAGRCNREGRLERGEVVVFVPPKPAPPGLLRKGEDACRSVLHGITGQPLERPLFDRYFERLYHACDLDQHRIGQHLEVEGTTLAVNFRTAAEKFRLIQDEDSASVVVRYRGAEGQDDTVDMLLNTLAKEGPKRWLMRRLQRYTVNIHRREVEKLLAQGDIREVMPGLYAQESDVLYHAVLGLLFGEATKFVPPTSWIVSGTEKGETMFGCMRGTVTFNGDIINTPHEPWSAVTGDEDDLYDGLRPRGSE
jgi:CRISPR-associated endonuclease/helicase Cas3